MTSRVYRVVYPFGGMGGGAIGGKAASVRIFDVEASFQVVGGIDLDPLACQDFEALVEAPSLCRDIAKMSAAELRAFAGDAAPDAVFLSPPCKGASGLLSAKKARTKKYRALNRLTLDWIRLMLEAWPDEPPRLVLLENVPRLKKRAARMLRAVRELLRRAGYVFHDGYHDCGELGGLAQIRRRYLLVARHVKRVPALLYQPRKKRVRACGEVLGTLPMPTTAEAAEYGRLHELPRLSWLNWVRLALIPAGGDWRDLPGVLEKLQARREAFRRHHVEAWSDPSITVAGSGSNGPSGVADPRGLDWYRGTLGVLPFDEPAGTITGNARASTGAFSVADPRVRDFATLEFARSGLEPPSGGWGAVIPQAGNENLHWGKYDVRGWDEPTGAVTGAARVGSGAPSVADPRPRFGHVDRVTPWEEPAGTVTRSPAPSSGGGAAADPRVRQWFGNVLRVVPWSDPAATVTGGSRPTNGGGSVADPRVRIAYDHGYRVLGFDEPSFTIAGGSHPGQGAYSVADIRAADLLVGSKPRAGAYGVLRWDEAAKTITGSGGIDNGPFAVVDPRVPSSPLMVVTDIRKAPPAVPVILSEDGTWHRPITSLEKAALQDLPMRMPDGRPLTLAGESKSAIDERIGNCVPPGASQAIHEQMLITLVASDLERMVLAGDRDVWVLPEGATFALEALS